MQEVQTNAQRPKARHKKSRLIILAAAVLLILLALFMLHPRGRKTFLVIGMDNYGSLNDIGRSDVTMLVQVDFAKADISVVTFARDMFIKNEKNGNTKINTIVKGRQEEGLVELLEKNFGVDIDGWFRVNFTSVIELVDAIGGAKVELTAQEARYINRQVGIYPTHPLSEGECQLNGAQALAYARCRKLDNDLGRGMRQGKLMQAMVAQTKKMTISNIVDVFNSLKHAWHSSLSASEQVSLLSQAIWLRGADVERISMPFDGHWRFGESYGVSGVVADLEANRALLREALGYPAETTAAEQE